MKVELLQNSVAEKKDVEESFAYIIYFYECPGSSVSQAIYISLIPVSQSPRLLAFLIRADSARYLSAFAAQKLYNNIHA